MKRSELAFTLLLVPLDFFSLLAAASAAFFLRFHPYFTALRPVIFDLSYESFLKIASPTILIWILVFAVTGLYTTRRRSIASEFGKIFLACSTGMALVFAILFFSRELFESRFIVIAAWGSSILFVTVARLVVRGLQRSLRRYSIGTHRIFVIGDNTSAHALVDEFRKKTQLGYEMVGHAAQFNPRTANHLIEMAKKDELDEIVLADPEADRATRLALITLTESEHLDFFYTADLFAAAVGRSVNHTYAGIPVIEVRKTPLDGWGAIYKRLFDLVGSLILIILTSPILLFTAIAIKLDSRGPILFSKTDTNMPSLRIGQHGKPFHYFKFRSMKPGTHSMRYTELANDNTRKGTPLVKIKNDPRVTRVGKFIRKFSLDELPEFFLVLNGKMSLVGPRPHLPEEVAKYRPEHKKVHTIKPGITGMAQISGRENLDFEDEVRLDVYYIEHWTPLMDFYVLLKTPFVVFFRKGAS